MRANEAGEPAKRADTRTGRTVRRADCEDNRPLPEQQPVRVPQRAIGIVDVGGLRRDAVQLNDCDITTRLERLDLRVPDVEATDEESWIRPRHLVDPALERWRDQMPSVSKH